MEYEELTRLGIRQHIIPNLTSSPALPSALIYYVSTLRLKIIPIPVAASLPHPLTHFIKGNLTLVRTKEASEIKQLWPQRTGCRGIRGTEGT